MKPAGVFILGLVLGGAAMMWYLPASAPCPQTATAETCAAKGLPALPDSAGPRTHSTAEEKQTELKGKDSSDTVAERQESTDAEGSAAPSKEGSKPRDTKVPPIKDDRDAQSFLRNNRWDDVRAKILASLPINAMDPQVEQMMGKFSGDVNVAGRDRKVWQMIFELDGNVVNSQFNGRLNVELSENGKVFSKHSGRGGIREMRKLGDGSQAIYLEASPTHHFQLYTVPDSDMIMGNLYMQNSAGDYRFRGTTQLYRQ